MTEEQEIKLVEQLAEEFAERLRRGERPSINEYAERFPQQAQVIRDTFEALAMMERLAPESDEPLPPIPRNHGAASRDDRFEQLGDYRIIREVGRGGMGIVYEAEQVSLGRHVALKVLPRELLDKPERRWRFQREAKAAAKLHHTNIVPVFGIGEEDDAVYYVMQFIQGLTLDKVLQELRRINAQPEGPGVGTDVAVPPEAGRREAASEVTRSLLAGAFSPSADAFDAWDSGFPVRRNYRPRARRRDAVTLLFKRGD